MRGARSRASGSPRVNVALLAFVDREYGAGFGTLAAAPDLR